ncbi:YoaK family protein [Rhodococcus sp. BH5]|uniref:YoaK family protein n=1 Tax=Rhodococcus sp. BH5 TaxID=2871702 RepID=UPI0022CD5534|nr:YoaK family protein [Rhodococcus sp. BH5]MCZ9635317.1 DUF1275 domain-containing protein [Rhodococcus sp. BH5]
MNKTFNGESVLSWVLSSLAGLIGSAAFVHTTGYFVTFMTGNTERGILGFFTNKSEMSKAAILLIISFVFGVLVASILRRRWWENHPHGATVLTTLSLAAATIVDFAQEGWTRADIPFLPILFVAFGIGSLNTSFVHNGEVSIPLSYITGTLVKFGQGIERHINGGTIHDWLGYLLLYASFTAGATLGGALSLISPSSGMLLSATLTCSVCTIYTYFFADRQAPRQRTRRQ